METREVTGTTKEIEELPETREMDRVESELNKTRGVKETKIQEETNRHKETTGIKCIDTGDRKNRGETAR